MGKELIGDDLFLAHVAERGRNALRTLSAVGEDQMRITTAEPEDVRTYALFSRRLYLFGYLVRTPEFQRQASQQGCGNKYQRLAYRVQLRLEHQCQPQRLLAKNLPHQQINQ